MHLLWTYAKKHRGLLIGAFLLAALGESLALVEPQIFRILIDQYASRVAVLSQAEFLRGILLFGALSITVGLAWRGIDSIEQYVIGTVTQRIGASMYARSVAHAFSLPFAVFEDQRSGELLQKLQKAREANQILITSLIDVVFLSLVTITFVVSYAFTLDWRIGLGYLLLIPAVGLTTFFITRRIKAAQETINQELAELAGSTTETLRNVELTKSLGLVRQEVSRLNSVNDRVLALELKKLRLVRTRSFLQGGLLNGMRMLLLLLMFWLIYVGSLTVGQLFSLSVYTFFIFGPLAQLNRVFTQYQESRAANQAVQKVLETPAEVQPKNPREIGALSTITLDNVHFRYQSATHESLAGISLRIAAGETVALVGPSGAGKTTMAKLLVGLYQPTKGALRVNDIELSALDLEKFRKRIGLVTQETQLFAGTIRQNLEFVRPKASNAELRRVLQQAAAESIVERGDKGLNTKIGEGGLKLSGGERQRLAIARALLRDPELIIFDEATSSLDSITEREITQTIQALERVRPNTMTILIAHRLSTILHAKCIYVLENGRVVEQGSHQELLKNSSLYAALWREQSGS